MGFRKLSLVDCEASESCRWRGWRMPYQIAVKLREGWRAWRSSKFASKKLRFVCTSIRLATYCPRLGRDVIAWNFSHANGKWWLQILFGTLFPRGPVSRAEWELSLVGFYEKLQDSVGSVQNSRRTKTKDEKCAMITCDQYFEFPKTPPIQKPVFFCTRILNLVSASWFYTRN